MIRNLNALNADSFILVMDEGKLAQGQQFIIPDLPFTEYDLGQIGKTICSWIYLMKDEADQKEAAENIAKWTCDHLHYTKHYFITQRMDHHKEIQALVDNDVLIESNTRHRNRVIEQTRIAIS